jgi:hypothetical protein
VAVAVAVAQPLSPTGVLASGSVPLSPKKPDEPPPPLELLPPVLEVPPLLDELLLDVLLLEVLPAPFPEDDPVKKPCDSGVDPHAAPVTSEAAAMANSGFRARWLMAFSRDWPWHPMAGGDYRPPGECWRTRPGLLPEPIFEALAVTRT